VLFLADAPEFARSVLRILRRPLQDGEIVVARSGRTVRFPARFTLVAGMSPCPCGGWPDCACSPLAASRYRGRFIRELGSHIAIWLNIPQTGPAPVGAREPAPHADAISAANVTAARGRARHRLAATPWRVNADIPAAELRRCYWPAAAAVAPLSRAVDLGGISTWAACHVVRVAWPLADLAGADRPGPRECGQALTFHLGVTR
jgi:magnesium chelatase family protein